ncbi:MAG: hypothetical protein ACFE0I_13490 [Elainellaceae cyanobacterium]
MIHVNEQPDDAIAIAIPQGRIAPSTANVLTKSWLSVLTPLLRA